MRGLAAAGTKLLAARADEWLAPGLLGHPGANYLLNIAILSDILTKMMRHSESLAPGSAP